MNVTDFIKARREKLGILCYKVPELPMKQYSAIWQWTWISYTCVLQTIEEPLKNVLKKYNRYPKTRENRIIKCPIRAREGEKREEDKKETKNKTTNGKQLQIW